MTFALGVSVSARACRRIGRGSPPSSATPRASTPPTRSARWRGRCSRGFVLVPRLGLQATFVGTSRVGAIGGVALAAAVLWPRARGHGRRGVIAGLAVVCGAFGGPGRHSPLGSQSARKRRLQVRALRRRRQPRRFRGQPARRALEYYREGAAATVSVRRLGGALTLAIDGKVDASNAGDMLTQRLLGVLPVLMHRDPEDLCVIGLGSGVTVGSAMATGLGPSRRGGRNLSGGRRSIGAFSTGERRRLAQARRAAGGGRRPVAPAADDTAIRCDRVGAVQPVDGRRRRAFHPRVLRGGARAAQARRALLPVGAHLRHQRRRPQIDRPDVHVGVSSGHDVARRQRGSAADRHRRCGLRHRASRRAHRRAQPRWIDDGGVLADVGGDGRRRAVRAVVAVRRRTCGTRSLRQRRAGSDRRSSGARVHRAALPSMAHGRRARMPRRSGR